jgi:hypothetical protein
MKTFRFVILLVVVISLVACSGQPKTIYEEVSPAALKPGDAIPAPTGEVILTVSGNISAKNNGDVLELDMATLEKFGLMKYDVTDPWLGKNVFYSGILMSDFLKIVGAANTAKGVTITALDEYEVSLTFNEIEKWPILLATQIDGAYMTVSENGPTRIIFPFDDYADIDQVLYKDLWVWNIKSIEVQ